MNFKHSHSSVATQNLSWELVLTIWALIDLWRIWTPSLITIFGQAAETGAEIMGGYALAVTATPLIALLILRRLGLGAARVLLTISVIILAILHLNLAVNSADNASSIGPAVQLYGSSLGVITAITALCVLIGHHRTSTQSAKTTLASILLGHAIAVSVHAALGSFAAVWRNDLYGTGVLLSQIGLLVIIGIRARRHTTQVATRTAHAAAGSAVLLLPALLLMQIGFSNIGRAASASGEFGPAIAVCGAWLALIAALNSDKVLTLFSGRIITIVAVILVWGATFATMPLEVTRDSIAGQLSLIALVGFALGPAALTIALAPLLTRVKPETQAATTSATPATLTTSATPQAAQAPAQKSPGPKTPAQIAHRNQLYAAGGAIIWTVTLFAFYAGYDLGYRADWLIMLLACGITLPGLFSALTRTAHSTGSSNPAPAAQPRKTRRLVLASGIAAICAVAAAPLAPAVTISALPSNKPASETLTVVAYNVRMGYKLNGVFDPQAVAKQIIDTGADIVMLSEVDRGWLLNGGQDQLKILEKMLDMQSVFGPAGDQVWGDAILTKLPISAAKSEKFAQGQALTGAAMTYATVRWHDQDLQVIATHLQPDQAGDTLPQARSFAQAIKTAAQNGKAVIAGGDLNTRPGENKAWQALLASDATDALASARPAATWPASKPTEEIDHLFVSGLQPVAAQTVPSANSDHLMVQITVR